MTTSSSQCLTYHYVAALLTPHPQPRKVRWPECHERATNSGGSSRTPLLSHVRARRACFAPSRLFASRGRQTSRLFRQKTVTVGVKRKRNINKLCVLKYLKECLEVIKEEIKNRGAVVSFTHGVRLLDRPAIKSDRPASVHLQWVCGELLAELTATGG